MKPSRCLRFLRFAAGVCLLALLPACSLFHHHKPDASAQPEPETPVIGRKTSPRGLTVELKASPDPLKLGEVRQIDVTLTLRNNTKQTINLKFATTQTIEILLREQATGKILSQWSTDQTFQPESRYVVINPHERIEYDQPITTRELHPGVTYSLEAYFIGYEQELRASRPIIPLP
jgi:hypothetical protein